MPSLQGQTLTFESGTLSLRLFDIDREDWPRKFCQLCRELKRGSMKFIPQEKVSGFTDLDYGKTLTGVFASVGLSAVKSYDTDRQTHTDLMFNTLDTVEFLLSDGLLVATGHSETMKSMVSALSVFLGCSVSAMEFEDSEMNNLLDILTNIQLITGKNSKESEVRGFSITGVLEDVEGYNFLDNQRTIEAVKGAYTFNCGLTGVVKLTRKGALTITARRGQTIPLSSITQLLNVLGLNYADDNDAEDADIVDDSEDVDDINSLF